MQINYFEANKTLKDRVRYMLISNCL